MVCESVWTYATRFHVVVWPVKVQKMELILARGEDEKDLVAVERVEC